MSFIERFKRDPDFDIGPGYLQRWYLIPRNHFFNIYLHKIIQSDGDLELHDHPWASLSIKLNKAVLREEYFDSGTHLVLHRWVPRFIPVYRSAKKAHRLDVLGVPVWTIFITGPKLRRWGFWNRRHTVWTEWKTFLKQRGRL